MIFPNIPARFHSDFSIQQSVERLSSTTTRSAFSPLMFECAAGGVSSAKVTLCRLQPNFRNSFKPVFVGRFSDRAGSVVLDGRFTLAMATKAFMMIWLSLALLITAYSVFMAGFFAVADRQWSAFSVVPVGLTMFAVGVAFIHLCWGLSRSEMDFLSRIIRGALKG